jgi:hypothetical protein
VAQTRGSGLKVGQQRIPQLSQLNTVNHLVLRKSDPGSRSGKRPYRFWAKDGTRTRAIIPRAPPQDRCNDVPSCIRPMRLQICGAIAVWVVQEAASRRLHQQSASVRQPLPADCMFRQLPQQSRLNNARSSRCKVAGRDFHLCAAWS